MSAPKPLRAVGVDEKPPVPESLAEAVASSDYLRILLAQRREIAASIPEEKGPAKAALHRQLSIVSKEIEALEARNAKEGGGVSTVSDGKFEAAAI